MGLGSHDRLNRKSVSQASGVKGDWKDKLHTIAEFTQMYENIKSNATKTLYTEEKLKQLEAIIRFKKNPGCFEFKVQCKECGCGLYRQDPELVTFREFNGKPCQNLLDCQKLRT